METPPTNRISNLYSAYRRITPTSIEKFSEYKKGKSMSNNFHKYIINKDVPPQILSFSNPL